MHRLDHVLWACPDLDVGIEKIAELTGVRPAGGGRHQGMGTHNALLSLGENTYLEIIAPDPGQSLDRNFGGLIASLNQEGLIAWAVRSSHLAAIDVRSADGTLSPLSPFELSRAHPQAGTLTWELLLIGGTDRGFPFFIDWRECPHPAAEAPKGCELATFEVGGPDPERIGIAFRRLQLDVPVVYAEAPSLSAKIKSPRGEVCLSSVKPLPLALI